MAEGNEEIYGKRRFQRIIIGIDVWLHQKFFHFFIRGGLNDIIHYKIRECRVVTNACVLTRVKTLIKHK